MTETVFHTIMSGDAPLGMIVRPLADPPHLGDGSARVHFRNGFNYLDLAAMAALLFALFNLGSPWGWLAFGATAGGSLFLRLHRAELTIDAAGVTAIRHRPFRPAQRQSEPRAAYVSLGYHLFAGRTSGPAASTFDSFIRPPRHVLFLRHRDDCGKDVALYWSTDFADLAPWQARLSECLGIPIEEMASDGATIIAAGDVAAPLAEREHTLPQPDLSAPPDGIGVTAGEETIVITLPRSGGNPIGPRIALAVLVAPALVAGAVLLPPPFVVIFAAIAALKLGFDMVTGRFPPLPSATRVVLSRRKGVRLHFSRLLWPTRRTLGWTSLMAVDIGRRADGVVHEAVILRGPRGLYAAGEGLPRPALEWLRAVVAAAAATHAGGPAATD